MSDFYNLVSVLSKNTYDETETCTVCPKTGEALDVEYNYDFIRERLNVYTLKSAPISSMKYLDLLPIKDRAKIISLEEGDTPLHHIPKFGTRYGVPNLYIKNEGANPTGVFKDRGSLVEITKAKELGAKAIVVASTGNMAASVSAYAAKAEIPCHVVIPEGTPMGKLSQSLAFGSQILQLRGTYDDCVKVAAGMAKKYNYYLAGDYAFRLEGCKTSAYEIIEQLGWKVPDVVIVPMGCGTHLSAIWKGFKEFELLGIVDKTPRMIGVQPEGCPAITEAFRQNKQTFVHVEHPKTICSAVAIGVPLDDVKALRAIRESGGDVETVSDEDILRVQQEMAQYASIFTEPSGAIPVAALEKLVKRGLIADDDNVVCFECGVGLKDPKSAIMIHSNPVTLEPDMESVDAYVQSGISTIKSAGITGKKDVVFSQLPKESELKKVLKEDFSFEPSEVFFQQIFTELKGFFDKRDAMQWSELKLFVDEFIAHFGSGAAVLKLEDFHITTSLHGKAEAEITVTFRDEKITEKSAGGGPVDAALTALHSALVERTDFDVQLKDYEVKIPSGGFDVSVKVDIVMQDNNKNTVIGTAASPDVIVASLQAFVNGFNLLWNKRQ